MRALRTPLSLAGLVLLGLLVLVAVLAPVLAPYPPRALTGGALEPPSGVHLLGTNDVGQDLFSQVVYGARASMTVAVGAATLAVLVASVVGVGAALRGGAVEVALLRVVDVALALPLLPLLVVVAALLGARRGTLVLVIGLLSWPGPARILRSQTRSLRQRGYVVLARGFGASTWQVAGRHLVPALGPYLVTAFVAVAGHAVLLEAGLAFLGLGDPTGVSWGLVLNEALAQPGLYFGAAWVWEVLPAGFAISLAVLGFALLGVGLEPALNPRLRGVR